MERMGFIGASSLLGHGIGSNLRAAIVGELGHGGECATSLLRSRETPSGAQVVGQ